MQRPPPQTHNHTHAPVDQKNSFFMSAEVCIDIMVTGRSLSSKQPNYCPVTETWMSIPSLSLFLIDSLSLTHTCTAILFAGIKLLPKSGTMVWHGPETPVSISNVTLLDFLWKIGKVELKFTPSWCISNLADSIFSSELFLSGMALYLRKTNVHCLCRKKFNLFGTVIEGWVWPWFWADVWSARLGPSFAGTCRLVE